MIISMNEIIEKKKHSAELSAEEINWFVAGYVSGSIPDYQAAALLMAICFSSLSERETIDLTLAMEKSGDVRKPCLDGFCVDKHSTGGVGDKTTLIIAPAVAACGVYVPKMSGRGLGHTGGTIDKLESIPGLSTSFDHDSFIDIVKRVGFAVAGQTGTLVPADKKLYALRSATSTVDSIPLIASSVMSKKLATGADGIVLDVTTGSGAFMKDDAEAEKLARLMVRIAGLAGTKCTAVISDMNQPLGSAVGTSLEVIEAIETLKGRGPEDLREVCTALASEMLALAGKGSSEECAEMIRDAIRSGAALEKLRQLIEAQGGNPAVTEDYSLFSQPKRQKEILASRDGYITEIACEKIGTLCCLLGSGRLLKDAEIDFSAGARLKVKIGDRVKKGDVIAVLYTSSECGLDEIAEEFETAFSYSDKASEENNKIIKKIIKGY